MKTAKMTQLNQENFETLLRKGEVPSLTDTRKESLEDTMTTMQWDVLDKS